MTAARPSEVSSLGFERHGWATRVLAGLLCVTTAWVPWALAWGDAVSDAGRAAQGEGRALADAVTLPQVNGNSLTLFPGQANQTQLDFNAVFPGSAGGNRADYTNLFGNDLGVVNAGRAAQTDLLLDDSATGAAYQTLRGSVDRSRPDMRNDPLWSQTDDVLDNFEDLAASFADCSIDTRFTEGERRAHVPDIHTCERLANYSGACDIRHAYSIEQILENGSGGTFETCGDGCVLWTVGRSFPTGPCYQELTGTMRVLKPEAITSAQIEDLWYEDYIAGLWIDGTNHYSHTAGECENDDSPTVWLGHDVTGYFKTAGEKRVLLALIQGGDVGGGTVQIRIRFDPSKALVADTWEDDPACLDLVQGHRRRGLRGSDPVRVHAGADRRLHPDHRRAASVPGTCCPRPWRGSPASAGTSP